MRNLDPARAKWIRVRMGLLCGLMALGLGGFVSSAYRVQVEDGAAWKETAENQRQRRMHVAPKRGGIVDRNGAALAASVEVPSVSADVVEMLRGVDGEAAQSVALDDVSVQLAQVLSLDAKELRAKLGAKRRFVWIKRRVTAQEVQAVRDAGDSKKTMRPIRGLSIEGEGHRYYPGRELAGPLIGFVAPDGQGKEGLELAFDEELRGRAEEVRGLRDRAGRLIFSEGASDDSTFAGYNLHLTLDQGIQHVAERELSVAQGTYETRGASVVVMEPGTGEILALASVPGYNPNDYSQSDVDARRNRPVTDRFEPGSVMKVFTVAAALAAGTLKVNDSIYCEHGSYRVANVTIHDTHDHDWLSPTEVLAKSSNIGALKIALALGEPGLHAAFRRFGFGEPTGLPVTGEIAGVLRPRGRPWFDVETANASFGQGIGVTTMQLAVAMSAIANGGHLMEPIVVRKMTDARGAVIKEWMPRVRRETVPAWVAKTVAQMLTAVVEEGGTGVEAAMVGFRVAGKTATAQKVDAATGKMSKEKYTASFVGFVPAEKPRLVIAVVLDEPMIGHYGGDLAGPVFRRVAEASLRYLGVAPAGVSPNIPKASRPTEAAAEASSTRVHHASLSDDLRGASNALSAPTQSAELIEPETVGPPPPKDVRVPDATGLGARAAVRVMAAAGLVPRLEGSGRLVRQVPPPGSPVAKGSHVLLVLEPAS